MREGEKRKSWEISGKDEAKKKFEFELGYPRIETPEGQQQTKP